MNTNYALAQNIVYFPPSSLVSYVESVLYVYIIILK